MQLTVQQAHTVYDLLLRAGAPADEHSRQTFVSFQTSPDPPGEYRICHGFGFGGKFWNMGLKLFITCYPEDERHADMKLLREINHSLDTLTSAWLTAALKEKEQRTTGHDR